MAQENEPSIADALAALLPEIDRYLAKSEVMIQMRPVHAAVEFSKSMVLEVCIHGKQWVPNFANLDFMLEPWFKAIYKLTEEWYEKRFGEALRPGARRTAPSFILGYGVPLKVEIPLSVLSPGNRPRTVWLQIPDSLLPDEDPMQWVRSPPNFSELDDSERRSIRADLTQVSNLLRSISSHKMGITGLDVESRGLTVAIRSHLDAAVLQVLDHWQEKGTAKAMWELQMACESALKAVAQTRTGSFRESHDLFVLYDDAEPHLKTIRRDLLKRLPRWQQMVEYRYAQGRPPRLAEAFDSYLATLQIVNACFIELATLIMGKGKLLIGQPPWQQPFESEEGRSRSTEP